MKITSTPVADTLEMRVEGRLDATWAEHLIEAVRNAMRSGHHHLRLDAAALEYISSAGLRSLLRAHHELAAVKGTFAIIRASGFVAQTIRTSGFDTLLAAPAAPAASAPPAPPPAAAAAPAWDGGGAKADHFDLGPCAPLRAGRLGGWRPWQPVNPAACPEAAFGDAHVAIGIGAPGSGFADVRGRMGDFLAVAGCTACMEAGGADAPDYLVSEGSFVPSLIVASALRAEGGFRHLLRFQPGGGGALPLSSLMEGVLAVTGAATAGFVLLAEVDGLVGTSLVRSPGLIGEADRPGAFPDIRDWLSFSGERVHAGAGVLAAGFVSSRRDGVPELELPPLPSRPGWGAHVHAAVFPFHPLPNGRIELAPAVRGMFAGAGPLALLHLLEDGRPGTGLGESAFIRGACWCSPLHGGH